MCKKVPEVIPRYADDVYIFGSEMLLSRIRTDEMKQAIIAKVSGLSADSEQDAELLDRIYRTLSSDDN